MSRLTWDGTAEPVFRETTFSGANADRENEYFPVCVRAWEFGLAGDGFGSPVPPQPAHFHTQAESGAYLRDSSRLPRRRPFIYLKPPYVIASVPSLSGHATAYGWRSLPRVRWHRASKPQGSSERVLPWKVTMDQFICAFFSPHPLLVWNGRVESTGVIC